MQERDINYQFFKLTPDQTEEFTALKLTGQMPKHGPLELEEEVEMHQHGIKAMYIVEGVTEFCGTEVQNVLGQDQEQDAVLVSANQPHSWLSRLKGTEIYQVHDSALVERMLSFSLAFNTIVGLMGWGSYRSK